MYVNNRWFILDSSDPVADFLVYLRNEVCGCEHDFSF